MNNRLKPTHQRLIGQYWVLWYESSNSYSIVTIEFKNLLDYYLHSDSQKDFEEKIKLDELEQNITFTQIENYLNSCNLQFTFPLNKATSIDLSKRCITKYYSINGKTIIIHFDCELVLKTIHPALAQYSINYIKYPQITFDLYLKDEKLYLYKNDKLITSVPKRNYHQIQGKFIMHLFCFIHNKLETDWIGTFHGSTITDGNRSILFIGKSGKGKSTLSALLSQNGFNLLADDVSPMLSKTKAIYYNPSAISIKSGAFGVLEPYIKSLPEIEFNKIKGPIKYLPCKQPDEAAYPCNTVIIVNFQPNAKTKLENVSIQNMMEILIPDSWISPLRSHAKEFLDWLENLNIYQLTYSDTENVINEISQLFLQNKDL